VCDLQGHGMRVGRACAQRTLAASPGPRRVHARTRLWRAYLRGVVLRASRLAGLKSSVATREGVACGAVVKLASASIKKAIYISKRLLRSF